jgi:hypothetical protein
MQPEVEIEGAELVINWFGHWPSLHDAEVIAINLDRAGSNGGPTITAKIHAFQMTSKVKGTRYEVIKHCIITFKFESVFNIELDDFNHQNVIEDITFSKVTSSNGSSIAVTFESIYGVELSLACKHVVITELVPGTPSEGVYA